jgi:hypothetical protein
LKSQITYKSGEVKIAMMLCLKKEKLIELMEDYPDSRKFYMDRSWKRRSEFKRR